MTQEIKIIEFPGTIKNIMIKNNKIELTLIIGLNTNTLTALSMLSINTPHDINIVDSNK